MRAPIRRIARWIAAGLLSIALGGTGAGRAEAALQSAPFAISVTSAPDGDGNRITLTVAPRPELARGAREPFDLYIGLLQGFQEGQFLDPSGRRVVDTFTPLWNSLSLFRVPQPHVVSLVAPWAGSPRYSITGWFRRG